MTLYEISGEMLRLADIEDKELDVERELMEMGTLFADKARNIVHLIKNLEGEGNAINDEVRRLQDKSRAIDNRVSQIKAYLCSEMIRTGQDSIKAGIFKIRLQNSPQSLIVKDVDVIPQEFKEEIHDWKVDKMGILRHLRETGEVIDGTDVIQKKHIRIY